MPYVSQGEIVRYSALQNWYSRLNNIITKYGQGSGISTLAVPSSVPVKASDVNNLMAKFNAMKSDRFLGYDKSLYTAYTVVSTGEIIRATTGNQIEQVIRNLELIRCRNQYTNANGVWLLPHSCCIL